MILLLHIMVAFVSMGYSFYAFLSPTKSKLRVSYGLAAATLASGIFLLANNPAHIAQACIVGVIYFGIVGIMIAALHRKLARIGVIDS